MVHYTIRGLLRGRRNSPLVSAPRSLGRLPSSQFTLNSRALASADSIFAFSAVQKRQVRWASRLSYSHVKLGCVRNAGCRRGLMPRRVLLVRGSAALLCPEGRGATLPVLRCTVPPGRAFRLTLAARNSKSILRLLLK